MTYISQVPILPTEKCVYILLNLQLLFDNCEKKSSNKDALLLSREKLFISLALILNGGFSSIWKVSFKIERVF